MRLVMKRLAGWIAAGLLAISAAGAFVASAQQTQTLNVAQQTPPDKQWARDRGDLPHDPDYIIGALPNGMRYLVLRNYTPPRQVAMLDFAVKLTESPDKMVEADRQALRDSGFTDRDIWDIAATASFYNMSNRMAAATEMRPNREYHFMFRDKPKA